MSSCSRSIITCSSQDGQQNRGPEEQSQYSSIIVEVFFISDTRLHHCTMDSANSIHFPGRLSSNLAAALSQYRVSSLGTEALHLPCSPLPSYTVRLTQPLTYLHYAALERSSDVLSARHTMIGLPYSSVSNHIRLGYANTGTNSPDNYRLSRHPMPSTVHQHPSYALTPASPFKCLLPSWLPIQEGSADAKSQHIIFTCVHALNIFALLAGDRQQKAIDYIVRSAGPVGAMSVQVIYQPSARLQHTCMLPSQTMLVSHMTSLHYVWRHESVH